MRHAPKLLGPWERIDRMIEDRCADAHAEIKRMAEKAIEAVGPPRIIKAVPYDNQLWALANQGMYSMAGLQAMSQEEFTNRMSGQYAQMGNAPLPWYAALGGAVLLPWE